MEIEVWFKPKNEKFIALRGRQPDLKMFKRSPSSRPKLVITRYHKLKAWGSAEIADITKINGIHVSFLWDSKHDYWFCQLDEDKVEAITELSSGKKLKHLLMGNPKPKPTRGATYVDEKIYTKDVYKPQARSSLSEDSGNWKIDDKIYPETDQDVIAQIRKDIDELILGAKNNKIPRNLSDGSDQPVAHKPEIKLPVPEQIKINFIRLNGKWVAENIVDKTMVYDSNTGRLTADMRFLNVRIINYVIVTFQKSRDGIGCFCDINPIFEAELLNSPPAPIKDGDVVYEGVTDAQGNTDEIHLKIPTAEEPIAMTTLLPLDVPEVQLTPQHEAPVAGTANKVMLKWGFRGRDIYLAGYNGHRIWFNRKTRLLYAESAIFQQFVMINEVPVVFTAIDPNEPISATNNIQAPLTSRGDEFKLLGEKFTTLEEETRINVEARKKARADAVQRYKSSVGDDEEARIVALEEAPRHPTLPTKWTDIINTWPWGIISLDEDTEAEIELAPKQSGIRETQWHQLTIITRLHKSPEIPEGGKVRMHPDLIPLKGCKIQIEGVWCGPFTVYDHLQYIDDNEQYYVPCLQCRVDTENALKIVEAVKTKLS